MPPRLLRLGLCLVLVAAPSAAQQLPAVDSLIAERMTRNHIPGLAIAVLDSGRILWRGTYGYSDVTARTPVTDSTPFQLASVSKPVTATILMSLFGAGRFALDDDVNKYLPFPVRNPNHPDAPITFRQLLIHRSSVNDNPGYFRPWWTGAHGDVTIPLSEFLREYLARDGKNYSTKSNFLATAPNERSVYCNTCYALLAYLAQEISGVPFEQLSREVLFAPLGMRETAWFLREFRGNGPAMPYKWKRDSGFVAHGQNGYPDWPAGLLRTSIRDISRFLAMYIQGGTFEGKQVLPPGVVATMTPDDAHLGFLTWFQEGTQAREVLYSHGGGDTGVRTHMAFTHRGKRGVVVLSNGEGEVNRIAEEVFTRIPEIRRTVSRKP
jgi:CubicO group peptidase (beta-lactamase class C family)